MKQTPLVVLMIAGGLFTVYGLQTLQILLSLVFVAAIILLLCIWDVKVWAELQVEKIASVNRLQSMDEVQMHDSIERIQIRIVLIEKRLETLENAKEIPVCGIDNKIQCKQGFRAEEYTNLI